MVLVVEYVSEKLMVTGNTFDVKGLLRNLGGVWEPNRKGWTFQLRREGDVMEALKREKVLLEDKRSSRPTPHVADSAGSSSSSSGSQSGSQSSRSGNSNGRNKQTPSGLVILGAGGGAASVAAAVVRTPASRQKPARSRTPPRVSQPPLPQVRLNERTMRSRVASLAAAAGAASASAPASDERIPSAETSRARTLAADFRRAVEEASARTGSETSAEEPTSSQLEAIRRAEAILAAVDNLSADALEASGIVREVARLTFCRGNAKSAAFVSLRRSAKKASARWLQRRAEAASEAEATQQGTAFLMEQEAAANENAAAFGGS
eukprot:TRINITY_DN9509_c0_g1_i2.p1 TRINITY_DN9509_c0_g1~~TRINITY_DN9509_c0_g1_i2.p1  ORF type:complete len:321 (-),score=75.32 TRINITY_DN9509_c0_g1_i2:228-1190(-)